MKLNAIKKNEDFRVVYRQGKSIANKHLVLYFYKNGTDQNRIGISVSKKVGKAVTRNLIKRRIKAAFQQMEINCEGYDFVVIARVRSNQAEYEDLERDLKSLFKRALKKISS